MPTPLFIQATLYDGPNFGMILVPYVDALPLEPTNSRALILDQLVGVNVPGMYVYDDSQSWKYAMPIEAVSAIVVGGDQCDLYINVSQTYNLGPTTIVYRNGQLQTGHDVTPASAVYAVRTPSAISQGSVTSVNGLTGTVVLTAQNITGFAAVAYSGLYSDLTGAPGPYSLPAATSAALGGVMVPATSNIQIDAQGNIDLASAVVTKINNALTDVQTSGTGSSLINTKASGVVTLKSLAAGSNVTITDDGAGTLTVASTGGGTITSAGAGVTLIDSQTSQNTNLRSLIAGSNITISSDGLGGVVVTSTAGAQSTTLQGDVTGTGTGTVTTTLANSGVTAGAYTKVTVDAKGRVTLGENPTTLAGFGITDALPLAGGSMTGSIVMTTGSTVTGVPDPVNALDAANKEYVDAQLAAAANGVSWRESAAVATTANLAALSGLLTIDGYTLQAGDRVLVKNQTAAVDNGVYDAASGAWTRSADSNTGAELYHAAYLVVNGTANGLTQWANTNQSTPVVGTDAITFGQLRAAGNVYTAGSGLQLSGLQFSIAPTGVAAGSYAKVTVNTLGQVTGGSALAGSDINAALGYTPYNGTTNPNGFIGALTATGDATGNTTISGSSGTLSLTLSNSGVAAGTYTSVTVDAKGRVTGGGQISPSQIVSALGYTPVNKAGDTMAGALNFASAASVASAATTNIGAASSNNVTITGTTTITAFDTITAGATRVATFTGALTLTHNSTSLILPSAANITTAAGDVAEFTSLGGGNWKCTFYQRANGQALVGGGSPYSTEQIFNGSTVTVAAKLANALEAVNIVAAAPAAVQNLYVASGAVQYHTVSATANWTLNVTHSGAATLNSVMATGESITVVLMTTQGATAFALTAYRIDGNAVTPAWQGGLAPGGGNANGLDSYSLTIIKTGNAAFKVLAAQVQFK